MDLLNPAAGGGLSKAKLALATATPADVLNGKKFYSQDKTLKTGTFSFAGTATAADVLAGKTFYGNGNTLLTGTLAIAKFSLSLNNSGYGSVTKTLTLPYPAAVVVLKISHRSEVGTGTWSNGAAVLYKRQVLSSASGVSGEYSISGSTLTVTHDISKATYSVDVMNIAV